MPVCAVQLCRNYVGKPGNNAKVTFHRFPTDPVLLERWTEVIQHSRNNDLWIPHRTSVVCSQHFTDKELYVTKKGLRRLINGAVPSKNFYLSDKEAESSTDTKEDTPASNIIEIEIEPLLSCYTDNIDDKQPSTNVNDESEDVIEDFSDLESVFDSAREAKMRRALRRHIILARKHRAVINSLRKKYMRVRKQNASLKNIIDNLKKQGLTDMGVHKLNKD